MPTFQVIPQIKSFQRLPRFKPVEPQLYKRLQTYVLPHIVDASVISESNLFME